MHNLFQNVRFAYHVVAVVASVLWDGVRELRK